MTPTSRRKLVFGIYPGGAAGGDSGLLTGPPDDPSRIIACLDTLQGNSRPFIVRCYDGFQDPGSPLGDTSSAPADYVQYAAPPRRPLDLVLQFRSASGNVSGYLDFIRAKLEACHSYLYSVQITEEANFTSGPAVIDGSYPKVWSALTEGVVAAKEKLLSLGRPDVKVGFNATPTFGPAAGFWNGLRELGGTGFAASLDYVGLDFFPGVFRPLAADGLPGDLKSSVAGVLETLRNEWLPAAGVPGSVPVHITEHGWATGPGQSPERQSEVLDGVIRAVYELSGGLNVERYTLFDLRDVLSRGEADDASVFNFFGILTADYAPKPAFDVFRRLIADFGV